MCNTSTPADKKVTCSRCGGIANPTDSWEHGWPLRGVIDMGFPSRLPDYIFKGGFCNETRYPELRTPLVTKWGYQDIRLEWGPNRGRYRLCFSCQAQFLGLIGDFFFTAKHKEWLEKRDEAQKLADSLNA